MSTMLMRRRLVLLHVSGYSSRLNLLYVIANNATKYAAVEKYQTVWPLHQLSRSSKCKAEIKELVSLLFMQLLNLVSVVSM